MIHLVKESDMDQWLDLRLRLWPDVKSADHLDEMHTMIRGGSFQGEEAWYVYVYGQEDLEGTL